MAGLVILMSANGCFTKENIQSYQRSKKQLLVTEESFVKKKEVCHLELADVYLEVMKSIRLILPNY